MTADPEDRRVIPDRRNSDLRAEVERRATKRRMVVAWVDEDRRTVVDRRDDAPRRRGERRSGGDRRVRRA